MSKFPFTTATIGSTAITASELVYGKGTYEDYGWDVETNVASGFVHVDRITRRGRGMMVLYGNRVALAHPDTIPCLSYAIVLTSTDGATKTRTGVITRAVYIDAAQATTINFEVDPDPPVTIS